MTNPPLKNGDITIKETEDAYIFTILSTKASRNRRGVFPLLGALFFTSFVGVCMYRELFVHRDEDLSDFWALSIFLCVGIAMLIIGLLRYYSDTTITITKDTIYIKRKMPIGLTFSHKRKVNDFQRVKEFLDFGDGETLKGLEFIFENQWNVQIGQHLSDGARQWLVGRLGGAISIMRDKPN